MSKKKITFAEMRQGNEPEEEAQWRDADADVIREVIIAATLAGGAVRFGLSRDRGAYSLGVYLGTEHHTEYLGRGADVNEWLLEVASSITEYGT